MREKIVKSAKRIVVKVGTSLLINSSGRVNGRRISSYASQIADLRRLGKEIIIVTSGAIGLGLRKMGIQKRPEIMPLLQAAASVGQNLLMNAYQRAFEKYNTIIGQILLTHDGLKDRQRFLNARYTIRSLLDYGVIPVINENDTVAIDEMKIGDNDTLSALVTVLVEADLLILLSDVDGLMTGDPKKDKRVEIIKEVKKITPEIKRMARPTSNILGTGGLITKLEAADIVTRSGEGVIIANGRVPNILIRLLNGEELGTFFYPAGERLQSRKRWLAFNRKIKGGVIVDNGAKSALVNRQSSLLPIGIIDVKGEFSRGDTISVFDVNGKEIARGIVNYSWEEVKAIQRKKTSMIKEILGYDGYDEVIHRDNLVIMEE